jgi:hypothetical protein
MQRLVSRKTVGRIRLDAAKQWLQVSVVSSEDFFDICGIQAQSLEGTSHIARFVVTQFRTTLVLASHAGIGRSSRWSNHAKCRGRSKTMAAGWSNSRPVRFRETEGVPWLG